MLRSYLKIALRNLWRHKEYSLINSISLGLGITCFILILLYVRYELGYDRYHSQADQIYRVELNEWASTPVGVGPFMKSTFPEVREAVRFFRANNKPIIRYADNVFSENGFLFADSSVFNVFDFTLLEGDPATALSEPNSLIISEAMARKYFPDPQAKSGYQHSLGKMVTIEITQGPKEYKVTGVFQNVPQQSHFNFDFLASFNSLDFPEDNLRIQWQISIVYTYLLLQPGTNLTALQENTAARFDQRREAEAGTFRVFLQPLTRIHLYSHAEKEFSPNSSITYIYIFSSIALFVLIIACVNFMNLATARSVRRAKEVGIRKVLGAFRRQLIMQFIGEALLITLIATVLAGVAIEILLPLFRSLSALPLEAHYLGAQSILPFLLGIVVLVTLLAGGYPAFYLSRYQPVSVLKGGPHGDSSRFGFNLIRRGLVVFQFIISIVLIVGTVIIYRQLDHLRVMDLGMNPEQVLVMPVSSEVRNNYSALKSELLKQTAVANVTASFGIPSERIIVELLRPEAAEKEEFALRVMPVDYDFAQTYGLQFLEGRGFSRDFLSDSTNAFILNEKAVALFGWQTALGKRIEFPALKESGEVVGVVKDFNFASLHSEVEPLAIELTHLMRLLNYVSLRFPAGSVDQVLPAVQSVWKALYPTLAFEYFFLDDNFAKLYASESKLQQIVGYFTALAILIACLGLFGLASFTVAQRTKEIGIRKVLGASIANLLMLLLKEFALLVIVANLIAWPLAWYGMNAWLGDFAYRVDIGWWVFALAGGVALLTALLTVSWQAVRTTIANPVDALRYE